jgi:hypothetical protein
MREKEERKTEKEERRTKTEIEKRNRKGEQEKEALGLLRGQKHLTTRG